MKTTSIALAIAASTQLLLITPSQAGSSDPAPSGYSPDIVGGLPLPCGVSVLYMWQQQDYDVTSLRAFAGGFPVPGFGANAITKIQNDVDEVNAKFDWWALPWLNFHAILGRVSGQADADLAPALWPLLGGARQLKVDYDGIVYGGGMTLAAGYKNFFGTVTANYTWGDVNLKDGPGLSFVDPNGIQTLVISPKVGWRFENGAVWVGGYYQHTNHTQTGSFALGPPLGIVNFQASVEDKTPWNYVVGGEYKISNNWILMAEVGFGGREQVLAGTTYRF